MNDLNSVYLVGRLVEDPKVKIILDDFQASFTLASNSYRYLEGKKEYEQKTSFFDIVVVGKANERIISKLKKGIRVGINGHLEMKLPAHGKKTVEIVSYTLQILDPAVYTGKNS